MGYDILTSRLFYKLFHFTFESGILNPTTDYYHYRKQVLEITDN